MASHGQPEEDRIETVFIVRKELRAIRRKAIRRGVWFKVLTGIERGILELSMRYVPQIRSLKLANILAKILSKVMREIRLWYAKKLEEIGQPIAEKLCKVAGEWGNVEAAKWLIDKSYTRFLGLCYLTSART